VVLIGVVVILASRPPAASAPDYPVGVTTFPVDQRRPLPALQGRTLDGAHLALADLRGHVVVLNVWASWCQPCQTESPALVALAGSAEGAQVRFVGLDERDTTAAALTFLHGVGSTYPQVADDGALLAQLSPWLPPAVPGSLVLDSQGRVAARIVGPATAAQLRPLLAA